MSFADGDRYESGKGKRGSKTYGRVSNCIMDFLAHELGHPFFRGVFGVFGGAGVVDARDNKRHGCEFRIFNYCKNAAGVI